MVLDGCSKIAAAISKRGSGVDVVALVLVGIDVAQMMVVTVLCVRVVTLLLQVDDNKPGR